MQYPARPTIGLQANGGASLVPPEGASHETLALDPPYLAHANHAFRERGTILCFGEREVNLFGGGVISPQQSAGVPATYSTLAELAQLSPRLSDDLNELNAVHSNINMSAHRRDFPMSHIGWKLPLGPLLGN